MIAIRNYSYQELQKDISFLLKEYSFLNCEVIGKSVCGRDIYCLSLNCQMPTAGCHLYNGGHHGLEWVTSWVLMRFIEEVCRDIEGGVPYECHFIPMINPDGIEIALSGKKWQANANGVDINHNYPAGWQAIKDAPAFSRFGGYRHSSEPETIAMMEYTKKINPSRAFALHSQGEEIYWDFSGKGDREYAEKLARLCGYKVAKPETLASFGGGNDISSQHINSIIICK